MYSIPSRTIEGIMLLVSRSQTQKKKGLATRDYDVVDARVPMTIDAMIIITHTFRD